MQHPDRVKANQLRRKAEEQLQIANSFAEQSHKETEATIADALSSCSEAHNQLSEAYAAKAEYFEQSAKTLGG